MINNFYHKKNTSVKTPTKINQQISGNGHSHTVSNQAQYLSYNQNGQHKQKVDSELQKLKVLQSIKVNEGPDIEQLKKHQ